MMTPVLNVWTHPNLLDLKNFFIDDVVVVKLPTLCFVNDGSTHWATAAVLKDVGNI